MAEDIRFLEGRAIYNSIVGEGLTRARRDVIIATANVKDILAQDANYTRNWSLAQDLKILIMTLGNMFLGKKRKLTVSRQEPT